MIDPVFNGLREVIPLDTDGCIPYYPPLALSRSATRQNARPWRRRHSLT
jgi:hypothetical protein